MTRSVHLAYGTQGLVVDLPADRTTVVEPRWEPTAADPRGGAARGAALAGGRPAAARAGAGRARPWRSRSATRPGPSRASSWSARCSTSSTGSSGSRTSWSSSRPGTHRGQHRRRAAGDARRRDRRQRAGRQPRRPRRRTLTWMGTYGDGVPVWLCSEWVQADVRITTGFVEPHFFAGFSGGPKMITPGLAGLETVLVLHDARRIGHPDARWGVCEGNPVHDDIRAAAAATGADFSLDVVLNREQGIVAAFGGDLFAMHELARERSREVAMAPVRRGVRGRPDDQRRLPARPEPLPGGEGHVGRRDGRPPRRADRVRGRVPRRLPRPRLLPRGARVGGRRRRRCSTRSPPASRPSPTSGRCRCRPRSR